MRIRFDLSIFGYHVGVLDVNLDEPSQITTEAVKPAASRVVKGLSRLWVKGMTS